MPTPLFTKGHAPKSPGRPKGKTQRDYMIAAMNKYGVDKFWQETFEKAKTDSTIRISLIKKLVPDQAEIEVKKMLVWDL